MNHLNTKCLILITALYCAWILSLPAFPSHDGPVHLYYVSVMEHLMASKQSSFRSLFAFRWPPPPYCLQYLVLLLLEVVMSPIWAEKTFICLIFVLSVTAAWFVAVAEKRSWVVLILPLLMNWPLFMGFHNYCLAIALAIWCWVFWTRLLQTGGKRWMSLTCVFAIFTLLAHPVPYAWLVGLLLISSGLAVIGKTNERFKALGTLSAILLIALYLLPFLQHGEKSIAPILSFRQNFEYLISLRALTFSPGGGMKVYRYVSLLLLFLFLSSASKGLKERIILRRFMHFDALTLGCIILTVLVPFLPQTANGLAYFSMRLLILIWMTGFLSCLGHPQSSKQATVLISFSGICLALFVLLMAEHCLRPAARKASLRESVAAAEGQYALLFSLKDQSKTPETLTFDPEAWDGMRTMRRSAALVVNDPFVNPPNILPLVHRPFSATKAFNNQDYAYPRELHRRLISDLDFRSSVLAPVTLLVFVGSSVAEAETDALVSFTQSEKHWICREQATVCLCESSKPSNGHPL
jgi:hypothetical protein